MAKGTGIARLAGSLAEKLARDVRRICKQQQTVSASLANFVLPHREAQSRGRVRGSGPSAGSVGEEDPRFEHKQTGVTYWAGCAACCCGDGWFRGRRWGC
jgi:hypothetical protein